MVNTPSLSSSLLQNLACWRNQQQEYWLLGMPLSHTRRPRLIKVIATGTCIPLITICAVTETVFRSFVCACVHMGTTNEFLRHHSIDYLSSSAFTISWSIAQFFNNFLYSRISASETEARREFYAALQNIHSLASFVGQQIRSAITENRQIRRPSTSHSFNYPLHRADSANLRHMERPATQTADREELIKSERNPALILQQGLEFFKKHIMQECDSITLEKILCLDPEVFNFVLARAIGIYIYGCKKEEPIPAFFTEKTQICIESLRTFFLESSRKFPLMIDRLNAFTTSLQAFSEGLDAQLAPQCPTEERRVYKEFFHGLGNTIHQEYVASGAFMQVWSLACNQS